MVRIVGVDIPNEKHVNISLTYIFGVGRTTADKILDSLSIKRDTKTKDLTEEEVVKIRDFLILCSLQCRVLCGFFRGYFQRTIFCQMYFIESYKTKSSGLEFTRRLLLKQYILSI